MQYGRSHVGKLSQLTVRNDLDCFRIVDNTRICYKHTRYIGPVFIQIRIYCLCDNRTCNIRTATGERNYFSVLSCPVKSRDHRTFYFFEARRQHFICLVRHKIAIFIKEDDFCCINKLIAQVVCHDDTV